MLIRRNSFVGQSLAIAVGILLANAAAYIPSVYGFQTGQAPTPLLWIHASMISSLILNLVYVLLYWHVAKRDGIDPWKRL